MSDDNVFVRVPIARWLEMRSREDGPVIVSGPDVRDPIYVQWPGDLEVVQYRPVPVIGMRQGPGWGSATTSGWIPGGSR